VLETFDRPKQPRKGKTIGRGRIDRKPGASAWRKGRLYQRELPPDVLNLRPNRKQWKMESLQKERKAEKLKLGGGEKLHSKGVHRAKKAPAWGKEIPGKVFWVGQRATENREPSGGRANSKQSEV